MRVVAWPLTTPGMVSCLTVVKAASRQDNGTGLAWLTAASLYRGSASFDLSARQRALLAMGAISDFWVDDDTSTFLVTAPSAALEKLLALEADRLLNPVFEGVGVRAQAGELAVLQHDLAGRPVEAGMQALRAAGFLKHPYGRPRLGRPEDLGQGLDLAVEAAGFHRRFYRPDATSLILTGDVNPERIFSLAERFFGGWSGQAEVPALAEEPPATSGLRPLVRSAAAPDVPSVAALAWRIPGFSGDGTDFAALAVAAECLFGPEGVLFQETANRAWAGGIAVECEPHRDPFLLSVVFIAPDPSAAEALRATAKSAALGLAFSPPPSEVLERAKRRLLAHYWDPGKNPEGVARGLGRLIPYLGSASAARGFLDILANLGAQQVQAAAARWLNDGGLVEAALFPAPPAVERVPP